MKFIFKSLLYHPFLVHLENTYEFDNINFEKIEAQIEDLKQTLYAYTKKLQNVSGIGGKNLIGGVQWKRLRACLDLNPASAEHTMRLGFVSAYQSCLPFCSGLFDLRFSHEAQQ